ncbi:hypothetical protein B0H13DRAFT_1534162, partial [Mycena leptocephala]
WLPETLEVLSRRDLGVHYRSLLETLIRVEELFGFEEMLRKGVAKELRPKEVSVWIGNAYDAAITDLDDYAIWWQTWWDSLQPTWRGRQGEQWRIYEEFDRNWDWGTLASKGPNGGLSIVASLYFWGAARKQQGLTSGWEALNQAKWHAAVQDVLWVYEGV